MNRQTGLLLLYKPDNLVYEIYDITYDSAGFPHFLFYREGEWLRKSAKYFLPLGRPVYRPVELTNTTLLI